MWSFQRHRSKQRKLLSCKSSWFLPNFPKWNVAALQALSWLMRANLAIFSLVFLKCGCKKLLAQLASPSEEYEGVAAVGWQGRPPACLQTFPRVLRLGGASCQVQHFAPRLPLLLCLVVLCPGNSQVCSDLMDVCDHGVGSLRYGLHGKLGPERAQAGLCLPMRAGAVFKWTSSAARLGVNPSSAEDLGNSLSSSETFSLI